MIYDYLILGCGLSGVLASSQISQKTNRFLIIDKGRGVGGRFATKRFSTPNHQEVSFNHGLREFIINPEFLNQNIIFRKAIKTWLDHDLIRIENNVAFCKKKSSDLIKVLLKENQKNSPDLFDKILLNTEAKKISYNEGSGCFEVETEGRIFISRQVYLTSPAEQTLHLCQTFLEPEHIAILKNVKYSQKILFLGLDENKNYQMFEADDHLSTEAFDLSETEILQRLFEKNPYLQNWSEPTLKKWRYALPSTSAAPCYLSGKNYRVYTDGFGPSDFSAVERIFYQHSK